METKTYHCNGPVEIHLPKWMQSQEERPPAKQDLVQRFKSNPDSFFPPMIPPIKPHSSLKPYKK